MRYGRVALGLILLAAAAHGDDAGTAEGKPRPPRKGEVVTVTGPVVDADGRPLAGVTVLLEASRTAFRLRRFSRETTDTIKVTAVTDTAGVYRHDWQWDPFYNTFAVVVALPVTRAGQADYELFERLDVGAWMAGGGTVTVPLTVADGHYLRWLQGYVDGQASADEVRVYTDQGRPDRFDREARRRLEGDVVETAWWYFSAGKVYRFRDGSLFQVQPFDPL